MGVRRRNEVQAEASPPRRSPLADRVADVVVKIRREAFWDAWSFAEAEVVTAGEAWRSASRGEKAEAWTVYRAALDREQAAAEALALRLAPA